MNQYAAFVQLLADLVGQREVPIPPGFRVFPDKLLDLLSIAGRLLLQHGMFHRRDDRQPFIHNFQPIQDFRPIILLQIDLDAVDLSYQYEQGSQRTRRVKVVVQGGFKSIAGRGGRGTDFVAPSGLELGGGQLEYEFLDAGPKPPSLLLGRRK